MNTKYTIDPQAILDAHAKTTQGTWTTDGYHVDKFVNCDGEEIAEFDRVGGSPAEDEANAAFCALAHNSLPEILELLRKYEDALLALLSNEEQRDKRYDTWKSVKPYKELLELAAEIKKERKQ